MYGSNHLIYNQALQNRPFRFFTGLRSLTLIFRLCEVILFEGLVRLEL